MLCGGFERCNGVYSERETDIKGLKKGRDLLGGGAGGMFSYMSGRHDTCFCLCMVIYVTKLICYVAVYIYAYDTSYKIWKL